MLRCGTALTLLITQHTVTARLQDLQRSFLRHLRAEGRSASTLRHYGQAVTFFSRWLEAEGRTAILDEPNRQLSASGWRCSVTITSPALSRSGTAVSTGSASG